MATEIARRLFSADEYERMIASGVFQEDDRLELIEGEIITMSPIGARHAACVNRLGALLYQNVPPTVIVSTQNPIRLTSRSEPQPDVTILRARPDFYAQSLPTPADVLLLIEVAETTLDYDRDVKIPRYAQAGIPEVWLIDILNDVVVRYSQPASACYQDIQQIYGGQQITSLSIPGLVLNVDDMLV